MLLFILDRAEKKGNLKGHGKGRNTKCVQSSFPFCYLYIVVLLLHCLHAMSIAVEMSQQDLLCVLLPTSRTMSAKLTPQMATNEHLGKTVL